MLALMKTIRGGMGRAKPTVFNVQTSASYSNNYQQKRGFCGTILLFPASSLGVHVHWQLEVFKGVEGDVSVVHHGNDHGDVSALERQQLDGAQVGNGTVEAAGKQRRSKVYSRH